MGLEGGRSGLLQRICKWVAWPATTGPCCHGLYRGELQTQLRTWCADYGNDLLNSAHGSARATRGVITTRSNCARSDGPGSAPVSVRSRKPTANTDLSGAVTRNKRGTAI